jgi:division protein CdvB (Snf7/Vps24/ESCRT-III family)
LQKSDFDTILQVNQKAIELQTETSEQYETIIDSNHDATRALEKLEDRLDKVFDEINMIKKDINEINKLQFKVLLLISSGVVSLLIQIIILLKK